jgi:hypothetical protein
VLDLSQEQLQALDQHPHTPIEVIDPRTRQVYLLVPAGHSSPGEAAKDRAGQTPLDLPPEIRRARAAFHRDLPQLLQRANLRGCYAAYTGDERIGIAADDAPLIRECSRRGIPDDHYYIGVIERLPLVEEDEEIEHGFYEFEEDEPDSSANPVAG